MTKPAASVERPRRRRLTAQQRKATIVAAATEVFSEFGYQRGRMSEVARRVGVTEPVIFQNFGSKAAVFAAVLDDAAGGATAAMHARIAANGSVGAWLNEFLAPEHLSRAHAGAKHHVLFADAITHATEPLVKAAIRRAHHSVARTLADLLARGQAEGSVRRDLDPQTGAWWLLCLLASQGFRTATMPDRRRLEAQLGALTLQALTTGHLDQPPEG